jgi:hypothetical protein
VNDTRPAGVGELLDRAVAMYVRSFVPIVAILAVGAVPSSLLLSFAGGWSRVIVDINAFNRAAREPYARSLAFGHLESDLSALLVYALIGGAITLLAVTACLTYIMSLDDGAGISIGEAFRRAAKRWFAQVGLVFVMAGCVVALYIGSGIVLLIVGLTFGALTAALRLIGVAGGVVSVIFGVTLVAILVVIALAAGVALLVVDQVATVEIAGGEGNALRAFGAGRRVATRRHEWRSTLAFAAVVLAVEIFGVFASAALGALLGAVHLVPVAIVTGALVALVLSGALKCFIVLYVRQARERRTGGDLLALIDGTPA